MKNRFVTEELLVDYGFLRSDDPEEDCSWWELNGIKLHQERWGDFVGKDFCFPTYMKGKRFKSGFTIQNELQLLCLIEPFKVAVFLEENNFNL